MLRALVVAAVALSAGIAAGQEARERPPHELARDEVFRLLDEHMAANLQEKLALTDEQMARTLPLVRRLHSDRRRFVERRMKAFHGMRRAVRDNTINDARAAELLQAASAAQAEEAAAIRAGQDAVDAVITPMQQVKYRVFETEIEHRLRELMARVRAERRDGNGRRRGGGPRMESPAPR